MTELGTLLFVVVFGLLIIGNFACQIYVASKVFKGLGVIRGILRGTPTFIRGWKQANELGIKDIMIFWTVLLSFTLLIICGVCGIFAVNGIPTGSRSQQYVPMENVVVKVVVAVNPIKKGEVFNPNSMEVQEWPAIEAPTYGLNDISETTGKTAAVNIEPGQAILDSMLK